jgi:Protein of unknown function (DUF4038)/Putative collagen-binding domain of a collagenase/Concanavalin A-like lectin/glucanases superfamily
VTSVQFVTDTAHMHRTTSVPPASGATMCCWMKITDYADWGAPMALSADSSNFCGMEFNNGGDLYFHTSKNGNYESASATTGSYAGWLFVAFTVSASGVQGYYHQVGGSWTAATNLSAQVPAGTMDSVGFAWESAFGGANGTVRMRYVRVWNVVLTATELQAERDSAAVVKTSNCVFNNSGASAASVGTDSTSTGNMTVAGTPTDESDEPPLSASLALTLQSLSLTQQAPTVDVSAGSITLEPGVLSMSLTQLAPDVIGNVGLDIGVQSLSLTQNAPTVAPGGIALQPGAQSLSLDQLAPTISLGGVGLALPAQSITLSQLAPSLAQSFALAMPSPLSLTLTQSAPLLYGSSHLHWKASSSGRYIVNDYDIPVLLHGDSGWCSIDQLDQSEALQYLNDLAARDYNTCVIAAPNNAFTDSPPLNAFGDSPWTGTAFQSSLNADYWDHVLWFMQQANARGIVPQFNPAYLGINNTEGWQDQVEAASDGQMQTYGEDVGTYLEDTDFVIIAYGDNGGNATHQARLAAMLTGLQSVGRPRLVSFHNGPDSPSWETSATDITTIHLAYIYEEAAGGYTHVQVREGYQDSAKPVLMFESKYENPGVVNEERVRRQAWGAMTYGACGHNYGHELLWKFETGWADYLDDTVRVQMQHLQRFFHARQWWLLQPDFEASKTFVTAGRGTEASASYVTAAWATDGSWGVAYMPGGTGPITVDRTELSDTFTARWFNPRTGAYTAIGTSPNTGTEQFTAPDGNDWVLALDVNPPIELGMPSPQSLSLTQQAPTLAFGTALQAGVQSLALTQQAPTLAFGGVSMSPGVQFLALDLVAPTLLPGGISVAIGAPQDLALAQLAPQIALGNVTLSPGALSLALSLLDPSLQNAGVLAPEPLAIALAQIAPALQPGAIAVQLDDVLSLALTQQAPTLGIEGPIVDLPAALGLTLNLRTPTLLPGPIALALTVQALTLDIPAPQVVNLLLDLGLPAPLAIALTQSALVLVNGNMAEGPVTLTGASSDVADLATCTAVELV